MGSFRCLHHCKVLCLIIVLLLFTCCYLFVYFSACNYCTVAPQMVIHFFVCCYCCLYLLSLWWTINLLLIKFKTLFEFCFLYICLLAGDIFNKFANWTEWDNNTGIIYETWTAKSKPGIVHHICFITKTKSLILVVVLFFSIVWVPPLAFIRWKVQAGIYIYIYDNVWLWYPYLPPRWPCG